MVKIFLRSHKDGITTSASCDYLDNRFEASSKKKSPIPILLRMLIDAGYPTDGTFIVMRGETQIFKDPLTVSTWAEVDFVDDSLRPAHKVKFKEWKGADED